MWMEETSPSRIQISYYSRVDLYLQTSSLPHALESFIIPETKCKYLAGYSLQTPRIEELDAFTPSNLEETI